MDALETTDIERAFWAYDRTSVSNIVVHVDLSGPGVLRAPLLRQALERVSRRHPYLGHAFSADGKFLVPTAAAEVGWRDVASGDGLSDLVHVELHSAFDLSRPSLVRATLVRKGPQEVSLLVTLAHPVSDAQSAYRFVREVIDAWDGYLSGGFWPAHSEYRFSRPRLELFPPFRVREPWSRRLGAGQGVMSSDVLTLPEFSKTEAQREPAVRSLVVCRTLDELGTAALRRRSRRLGVSLNSLLTTAMMLALAKRSSTGSTPVSIRMATAVNLRPMLPELNLTSQDLGMWAGRFDLFALVGPGAVVDDWARAFHEAVASLKPSAFDALRRLASPQPFSLVLKMSNHGDFDRLGLSAPLISTRISAFRGYTPLHRGVVPRAGVGGIASIFGGRLDLSFVFPEDGSLGPWSQELIDVVLRTLSEE